ncbi:phenylacetate--CoA ligase family protein [Spongiivirga citrea]|uniref:Phenylacetate--CoA ligase family protein n=1 Tax=Spongiivirga citrea TaxID=1481457 RepID=A0A6M0CQ29_9FLAO|nr:hypothetical protein [Spongiivirga citrea]NER16040.1 hypothetical protein [Spongiivirga citrea]
MGFFEKVRTKSFWAFDAVKGGVVRKYVDDIESIFNSQNKEETKVVVNNYLDSLKQHATSTVPFYKNYENADFLELPVVSKKQIVTNYDSFYSKGYNASDCVVKSTSGSTGEPFKVRQDLNKVRRNNADTIFFSKLVGYNIGYPLYFIRFWDVSLRKSGVDAFLQNIKPYEIIGLNEALISEFCRDISKKDKTKKSILAYSSGFDKLVNYLEDSEKKYDFSQVSSLIAMSEALSDTTKKKAAHFFNVPIVSRYSNTENGIIAQQLHHPDFPNRFYINTASYYVEIVHLENDKPADHGTVGRIVVTDLFNYAMPLIRYDTGDLGVMNVDEHGTPFLERIEGRIMDAIFNTKGDLVSSFIPTHLEEYPGIIEYQFDQISEKGYAIFLVINNKFKAEQDILDYMKTHFGQDANIQINYIDSIPLLSSGKRKKVLNTFKNPID